jgi:hypothetical protein
MPIFNSKKWLHPIANSSDKSKMPFPGTISESEKVFQVNSNHLEELAPKKLARVSL